MIITAESISFLSIFRQQTRTKKKNTVERAVQGVGMEASAAKAPAGLEYGTVIRDRFKVENLLGSGGFGEVFLVEDKRDKNKYAMKIEHLPNDKPVLKMEVAALKALSGEPHVPSFISSGWSAIDWRGCRL
jgi:hypothetical protein